MAQVEKSTDSSSLASENLMATISFSCPQCNKPFTTDATAAGKKARCPACSHHFTVPHGNQDEATVAPILVEATAPLQRTKKCRYCGEDIAVAVIKCKYCGEWLQQAPAMSGSQTRIKVVPPANAVIFTIITLGIYQLFWLHRVFTELHARASTKTTPGKAVGFCFIPFFNFVWIFVVWKRLGDAVAYEYTRLRRPIPATTLVLLAPIGITIGCLLNLVAAPAGSVIALILLPISLGNAQAWLNQISNVPVGPFHPETSPGSAFATQTKPCPTCGEAIPTHALLCRYCGQHFSQEDVNLLQQRNEEMAAQAVGQLRHRSLRSKRAVLQAFGIPLTVIGGLLLVAMIVMFFGPPAPGNTPEQQRVAAVVSAILVAVPLICVGIILIRIAAKVNQDLDELGESEQKTTGSAERKR